MKKRVKRGMARLKVVRAQHPVGASSAALRLTSGHDALEVVHLGVDLALQVLGGAAVVQLNEAERSFALEREMSGGLRLESKGSCGAVKTITTRQQKRKEDENRLSKQERMR